jgi:hypothetical protein
LLIKSNQIAIQALNPDWQIEELGDVHYLGIYKWKKTRFLFLHSHTEADSSRPVP